MIEKQGKIAFLGFNNMSEDALHSVEKAAQNFPNFEWKVAGSHATLRDAAAAVTTIVDRKVIGEGGLLFIAQGQDPETLKAAGRLSAVGVNIQFEWTDFDPFFEDDTPAVLKWLAENAWPEKRDPLDLLLFPEGPAEDPLGDLLGEGSGGGQEASAPTPAPAAAQALAPKAEAAQEAPAPAPAPAPVPAKHAAAPVAAAEPAAPKQEEPAAATGNQEPAQAFPEPPADLHFDQAPSLNPTPALRLPAPVAVAAPAESEVAPVNPLLPGGPSAPGRVSGEAGTPFLAPGPETVTESGLAQAVHDRAGATLGSPMSLPAAVAVQDRHHSMAAAVQTIEHEAPPVEWFGAAEPPAHTDRTGQTIFCTGTHGGSGKTTFCYLMAHTTAQAFKRAGNDTPVYQVESDFGNPKWENRLQLKTENTSYAYVQYMDWLELNKGVASEAHIRKVEQEAIDRATWTDPKSGLRIIAAPYDTRQGSSTKIQTAIVRLVRVLQSQGAYVFIDSGTAGRKDDKIADRELAGMADHVFVATRAGERDPNGTWRGSYLADFERMARTFTSPIDKNGWGLDKGRVMAFFNETSQDSYFERCNDAFGIQVIGHMDYVPSFKGSWIGDKQEDPAFVTAVVQTGRALEVMLGLPELTSFKDATPPPLSAEENGRLASKSKRRFRSRRSK